MIAPAATNGHAIPAAGRLARLLVVTAAMTTLILVLVFPAAAQPSSKARSPLEQRVDEAIVKGLEYLAAQQESSGSWRVDRIGQSTAATSLAVMSFLAAGHVPGEGPYGTMLEKGIRWVIAQQDGKGFLVAARSHGPMYDHGISTLMLAEVIGMLQEPLAGETRRALEKAVELILLAQKVPKSGRNAGGWRYHPTSRDSDLSVTGWQLLSLRGAKNVGCDVPAEAIDRAVEYVKNCAANRGFAYQPGGGPTATRTGTGITCLEVCGEHHSQEALDGADSLLTRPLDDRSPYFYYGAYYCSVGMFLMGDKYWKPTRELMIDLLLPLQDEKEGYWQPRQGGEANAGRNYATSMAVLALAVEYQYLPIYQR